MYLMFLAAAPNPKIIKTMRNLSHPKCMSVGSSFAKTSSISRWKCIDSQTQERKRKQTMKIAIFFCKPGATNNH